MGPPQSSRPIVTAAEIVSAIKQRCHALAFVSCSAWFLVKTTSLALTINASAVVSLNRGRTISSSNPDGSGVSLYSRTPNACHAKKHVALSRTSGTRRHHTKASWVSTNAPRAIVNPRSVVAFESTFDDDSESRSMRACISALTSRSISMSWSALAIRNDPTEGSTRLARTPSNLHLRAFGCLRCMDEPPLVHMKCALSR